MMNSDMNRITEGSRSLCTGDGVDGIRNFENPSAAHFAGVSKDKYASYGVALSGPSKRLGKFKKAPSHEAAPSQTSNNKMVNKNVKTGAVR